MLKDPQAKVRSEAISQTTRPLGAKTNFTSLGTSIRTDQFRYTQWTRKSDGEVVAEELYDLSIDPLLVENLVDEPRMKRTLKEMKEKLAKLSANW